MRVDPEPVAVKLCHLPQHILMVFPSYLVEK